MRQSAVRVKPGGGSLPQPADLIAILIGQIDKLPGGSHGLGGRDNHGLLSTLCSESSRVISNRPRRRFPSRKG